MLLAAGASLDAKNKQGQTPLDAATVNHETGMVVLLNKAPLSASSSSSAAAAADTNGQAASSFATPAHNVEADRFL